MLEYDKFSSILTFITANTIGKARIFLGIYTSDKVEGVWFSFEYKCNTDKYIQLQEPLFYVKAEERKCLTKRQFSL